MSEPSTTTGRGVGQVYMLFATSLLLVLTVGGALQLVSMAVGLAVTELVLILLPAILFIRWKRVPLSAAFRWRAVPAPVALLGIALGVTGWGVAAGIHQLTVPFLGEPPDMPGLEAASWPQLLLILVFAALLPAFCEETLFRGAIQGVLARRGVGTAVVITSILFGVYHMSPWSLVPAFFLGLVFGSLTERTGSTVSSMLAHFGNNATAVTVAYVLADQPESVGRVVMVVLAAAFCVTFAVFWWYTRGATRAVPALAAVPAGLSRVVAWLAGVTAAVVVSAVAAVVAAAIALVDVYTVPDDALEPAIHRGDILIASTRHLESARFAAGDIIAVRQDGGAVVRRIARVEGDTVWIEAESGEQTISRDRIVGRVIQTIPMSR